MANVNYNFQRASNPHTARTDHLAVALSKIGGDLITDAMQQRRQESLDKKQDARTKLSNERTDARNTILDARSDKALDLQAANRSEDMAYRDAESARNAQYQQDSLAASNKLKVKETVTDENGDVVNIMSDGSIVRAGEDVSASQMSNEELFNAPMSEETGYTEAGFKPLKSKEKATQNKEIIKGIESELNALVKANANEFISDTQRNSNTLRINEMRGILDKRRGITSTPTATTAQPTLEQSLIDAKARGGTLAEVNTNLKRLNRPPMTQKQWDAIGKTEQPTKKLLDDKTASSEADLLNKTNEAIREKKRVQPLVDRAKDKAKRAATSAAYTADKESNKKAMSDKAQLEKYLNTGSMLRAARQKGKDVVTSELEEMWKNASPSNKKLIEAQLATLKNVKDIK